MLQEARARIVDVETGAEERPLRALADEPPPREPPPSRASDDRAAKRPSREPAPVVPPRARPQPGAPSRAAPPSTPVREPDPGAAELGDDALLSLDDQPGHTVTETGDGSKGTAPWRRGLRG